jgi:hypothetical protein
MTEDVSQTAEHTPKGTPKDLKNFEEFWPFYVHEHSNPLNRRLHFVGTSLALASLVGFAVTRRKRFLAAAPVMGYAFAWIGHFIVEKNRPATFTYPGKSLLGDFRMFGLMASGRMKSEIEKVSSDV